LNTKFKINNGLQQNAYVITEIDVGVFLVSAIKVLMMLPKL